MSRYLVRRPNGTTDGPYTSSELRELAYEGRLRATDEISPMGEVRWVPASKVGGVKEIIDMLGPSAVSAGSAAKPSASSSSVSSSVSSSASPPSFSEPTHSAAPSADTDDSARTVYGTSTPSRAASPVRAAPETARRYGMLRFSASALASYGWVLMALVFAAAIFFSGFVFFQREGLEWSAIIGLLGGFALMELMRRLAKSTEHAGFVIAIVFLPLVMASLASIRAGVPSLQAYFALMTPVLVTVGTLFGSAVAALLIIAVADFFTAHADIATNSWNRARQD